MMIHGFKNIIGPHVLQGSWLVGLAGLVWANLVLAQDPKPDEGPTTPKAALEQMRKAFESDDLASLAKLVPPPNDRPLAELAEAFGKAKTAYNKLEQVIKDKPNLAFNNPFHPVVHPFSVMQLDVVEINQEGSRTLARIRFGPRGKPADEEVLLITPDGATWRVTLPALLTKQLQRLTQQSEQLKREISQLDKLAQVLTKLASEIEKNQIKSKELLLLHLARLVDEYKLAEPEK